jgi:hypothetical protein
MSIAEVLSLGNLLHLDPTDECRFCHCSETTPCTIAIAEDGDGKARLARTDEEIVATLACRWYIPGVCSAPRCVEKLVAEWNNKVLLFDAAGHELALDVAASDRDFRMIGIALGLPAKEITREAILDRIHKLCEGGRKRRSA